VLGYSNVVASRLLGESETDYRSRYGLSGRQRESR